MQVPRLVEIMVLQTTCMYLECSFTVKVVDVVTKEKDEKDKAKAVNVFKLVSVVVFTCNLYWC